MVRIRLALIVVAAPALAVAATLLSSESHDPKMGGENREGASSASFEEVFVEKARIHLTESPNEPMGAITGLAFDPDGRIAVADRQSDRVFVFEPDGELRKILGRSGEGPGEYESPTDVAFDHAGRLFVSDGGGPRIAAYDAGLSLDTVLSLSEASYAMELAGVGEDLLAYVNAPGERTPRLRLLDSDGREIARFHPSHPAYVRTPYWSAATSRVLATSRRWIVAGGNLMLPLARYTPSGALVDSVGRPPRSWRQASRPKRGAFQGPDQLEEFERWRRSFTTIQNVAVVRDRDLVVSHQRLDPDVLAYQDAEYFADVYDLEANTKVWTEVALPGAVLAGGPSLTLLVGAPPGGWVLGRFQVTG